MARQLDFYFDCSSPWTYLAFHAVQPLAADLGAEIAWKPILVGGVFNAVNQTVYDNRAKLGRHRLHGVESEVGPRTRTVEKELDSACHFVPPATAQPCRCHKPRVSCKSMTSVPAERPN